MKKGAPRGAPFVCSALGAYSRPRPLGPVSSEPPLIVPLLVEPPLVAGRRLLALGRLGEDVPRLVLPVVAAPKSLVALLPVELLNSPPASSSSRSELMLSAHSPIWLLNWLS